MCFGANVVVAQLQGFAQSQLQHLLGPGGEGYVTGGGLMSDTHCLDHRLPGAVQIDAEAPQRLGGDALSFRQKAQQQVFGAYVFMVHLARFFLRHDDHSPGPVRKSLEQRLSLLRYFPVQPGVPSL